MNFLTTPILYGLAAVAVVSTVFATSQVIRVSSLNAKITQVELDHKQAIDSIKTANELELERLRQVHDKQVLQQQGNLNEALEKFQAENSARVVAVQSVVSMRDAIKKYNRTYHLRAPSDPASSGSSSSETFAELVPAELYYWSDKRAEELAGALGDAHTRGQLCERNYDTLIKNN